MKRSIFICLTALLLFCAAPASAQTSKNPMQEITTSLLYGGVAGLAVGGVVLVANGGENIGGVLRWSFVTGAFVGLGYGIYQVSAGSGNSYGLLNYQEGRLQLRAVMPELGPGRARVTLIAARF